MINVQYCHLNIQSTSCNSMYLTRHVRDERAASTPAATARVRGALKAELSGLLMVECRAAGAAATTPGSHACPDPAAAGRVVTRLSARNTPAGQIGLFIHLPYRQGGTGHA